MKFVRFGPSGHERPGVLMKGDEVVDISSIVGDLNPSSIGRLPEIAGQVADQIDGLPRQQLSAIRLASPVVEPSKIIGIGLNYVDHAAESSMELPKEPIVFMKAPSALSGPYDDILIPPAATRLDWEVELGVVVGSTARYLESEASSRAHIGGYLVAHDVSEREHQLEHSGQWTKGKSADTFAPIGPWLVTPDEISDHSDLDLECRVNGAVKQSGNTRDMIFSVDHIIWHLSQYMTLVPGDIIMTGTPPGVGLGTGEYLDDGDVVELTVSGLGKQQQTCKRASAS